MKLLEVLNNLEFRLIFGDLDNEITSVEYDSRKVTEGSLFVCVRGFTADGHSFASAAVAQGAAALAVDSGRDSSFDEELERLASENNVSVVEIEDTHKHLSDLSANFYGHPENRIAVYGITGTKGKTTTAFMLREILEKSGKNTGLIGTVRNIIGNEITHSSHTTPESRELFDMMNRLVQSGSEDLVMEVSSQALKLDRVRGVRYRTAAFTNLYEDHIAPNEHPDMEDYLSCKLRIFDNCDAGILNLDCSVADRVIDYCRDRVDLITYSIDGDADFVARNLRPERKGHVTGTVFELDSKYYKGDIFVALPGRFNVYNSLCAICSAYKENIDIRFVKEALAGISVPGRMQPVENDFGVNILVDYAHNAAALESALNTLREYTEGRIITVFGCGGNRSVTRRFEMGEVSGNLSDHTIITSDNPRKERPEDIINDIVTGISKTDGKYEIEPDRTNAIRLAVSMARKGDTVLIAGKGHEDYQIFENETIHFDDSEKAREAVLERETRHAMFTLEEVKKAVGGRLVSKTGVSVFSTSIEISGVSTDTRKIREGELFIALKGDNFNGNDFLGDAVDLGACAVITDDEDAVPEGAVAVVVEDTVRALGLLANHYRFKLGCKVIAVTGSVGKTSTRTMIAEVLKTGLKVHSTVNNNNNEIGMSKTILSAPEDSDVIVVEMGMRGLGQISYLTGIARPDIAIITNIGYSHIELLESKDNIMKAKMEICEGLTDGGIVAVNSDDRKLFDRCVKELTINNFIAGIQVSPEDDLPCPLILSATDVKETETGMSFGAKLKRMGEESVFSVPLNVGMFGEAAVRNALFAIFCAYMTGITGTPGNQQKIADVISKKSAVGGRGAIIPTARYLVMDDAYNASPESMENAFLNFSKKAKGHRKVLALGGMLELGKFAPGLHELTGKACASYDFDRVFITGENADDFIKGAHMVDIKLEIVKCKDTEDVKRRLEDYVRDGDALLFKASHGFGFEDVAKYFIGKGNA
ncbi:MAG: UDP-N-acetylmuramoyl-L-alanyl-D-glutamate--2,6-diaminopimelate ligase [Clostridiales bacterium]|nr:UDP-N-acetylmuramoyl-L-alanyl-D-glutamate--2,6-diaminopimelate ligase [Clostridiales bacterium]